MEFLSIFWFIIVAAFKIISFVISFLVLFIGGFAVAILSSTFIALKLTGIHPDDSKPTRYYGTVPWWADKYELHKWYASKTIEGTLAFLWVALYITAIVYLEQHPEITKQIGNFVELIYGF